MSEPGCPVIKLQTAALGLMKRHIVMNFCKKCTACVSFIMRAPDLARIVEPDELKTYITENRALLSDLLIKEIETCNRMPIHMILYFDMSIFNYDYRIMSDYRFSDRPASTMAICIALAKIAIEQKLSPDPIKEFAERRNVHVRELQKCWPTFQFTHDEGQTITPVQIKKYGAYFNMAALTHIIVLVGVKKTTAAVAWLDYIAAATIGNDACTAPIVLV